MTVTKTQVVAALHGTKAVADVIRELKEIPSGHLYAQLMGTISLETYNRIIKYLLDAELIQSSNHLLIWTGPR